MIGHEELDVHYSFLRNTLLVTNNSPSLDGGYRETVYTGTLSERQGVVRYWYLRDPVTHTQETWVIFDPYYDPIKVAEGVQVTVDLRGLPVATGQVISRTELSRQELENRLPREVLNTDPLKSFLANYSPADDALRSADPDPGIT
ncbi:hypothetical protein [Cryptosporangium sp. NPDC048952]|uniref:hypothetical protein n=1 Tax=Cryptosporangium sp. NPDC048952 TaxID=3363961 RepID=UPI00371F9F44